jgi:putative ABC transport system permease protein
MLNEWRLRFWYLVRRDRMAADLEEEMRIHREMRAASLQTSGAGARAAELEARRRFGNVTMMTEESRAMWGFDALEQWLTDLRFAARRLRQRPALSVPVIVVLALGIGATTAVFSAADAAMLRGLPFPRARDLYTIPNASVPFAEESDAEPGDLLGITHLAQIDDVFVGVAAYAAGGLNLVDDERPLRVNAGVVTATFFSTIGVQPLHGRSFSAEEGRPNGPLAVVLSYGLWQGHFGGQEMLGRSVRLNNKPYTVVGIMPPRFGLPKESQLWIPMSVPNTFATFEPFRGFLPSTVIARTHPDVHPDVVRSAVLAGWHHAVGPATGARRESLNEWVQEAVEDGLAVPLRANLLGKQRTAFIVLLGATGFLLLIACANVANLLLSDGAVRRREIALRQVLGARRGRVVRQLLVESLMLALAGAAIGIALAPVLLRILAAMMPAALAGVSPAQLDLRVLAFAAALAVVASLLFGLWPAFGATRGDANTVIKSGGGHGATAGSLGAARRALVFAEMTLTVMLLVGAGLMLRSFGRMMAEDTGLNAEQVATVEISFPGGMPPAERLRVQHAILGRLATQPGIVAAGLVNDLPLRGGGGISVEMTPIDGAPAPQGKPHQARQLTASGGYFEALGIRLLHGRTFAPPDDDAHAPVAIISKATADAWWPGRSPIGQRFYYGRGRPRPDFPTITVIGVVDDVREGSLEKDPNPQMYHSSYRSPPANLAFVVRGTLPPAALLSRLSASIREVVPTQPVYNLRMMEDVIGASVAPRRTNTVLIGLFAVLALVLSALGVYAVVAYGVAQRTREFGIRAALGARGTDLVALVSREMLVVVGLAIVAGLGGAWALSRVVASLLYEIQPRDPITFAVVPLVLVVPAIVATLIPAFRATRVNPSDVMRTE